MSNVFRTRHGAAARRTLSSTADGLGLRDGLSDDFSNRDPKDWARRTSNGTSRPFR